VSASVGNKRVEFPLTRKFGNFGRQGMSGNFVSFQGKIASIIKMLLSFSVLNITYLIITAPVYINILFQHCMRNCVVI